MIFKNGIDGPVNFGEININDKASEYFIIHVLSTICKNIENLITIHRTDNRCIVHCPPHMVHSRYVIPKSEIAEEINRRARRATTHEVLNPHLPQDLGGLIARYV